ADLFGMAYIDNSSDVSIIMEGHKEPPPCPPPKGEEESRRFPPSGEKENVPRHPRRRSCSAWHARAGASGTDRLADVSPRQLPRRLGPLRRRLCRTAHLQVDVGRARQPDLRRALACWKP